MIFHWDVPEKKWITQLTLDRSLVLKDGLFMLFTIESFVDSVDFPTVLSEGRQYLSSILREIGLELPEEDETQ